MNVVNNSQLISGFSVIVPTFHEAKNIAALVHRVATMANHYQHYEMILVDDNSQDGIDHLVANLQSQYPWLTLLVRKNERGLSSAVIDGLKAARYDYLIVMDADLSHPPEKIPDMLAALADPSVDFVIGSRYVPGATIDGHWPLARQLTSKCTAFLTKRLLGIRVRDPLSGFIGMRRDIYLRAGQLKPIGWKIGLEIMVRCRCQTIREIPIHFSQRSQGKSKLRLSTVWQFGHHLACLLFYKLF